MAAKDFYLYFSGTQGSVLSQQKDFELGGVRTSFEGMDEFKGITGRPGVELERWVWTGSVTNSRGVKDARDRLLNGGGYEPGVSVLIVYGYSAGGKNALELCREFDNYNLKYSGESARLYVVTVNLLVTVDAAAFGDSDKMDRRLAKCVKRNVNYFQERGGMSGSHGAPNLGDKSIQKVHNIPRTESHGDMSEAVMPAAKSSVQSTIDSAASK